MSMIKAKTIIHKSKGKEAPQHASSNLEHLIAACISYLQQHKIRMCTQGMASQRFLHKFPEQ